MNDVRLSDKYRLRQQRKEKKRRRLRAVVILSAIAALAAAGMVLYSLGVFTPPEPAVPADAPVMDSRLIGVGQPTQMVLVDVTPPPTAPPDPAPLLVNSSHPLPDGYVPDGLVVIAEYCDPEILSVEPAGLMAVDQALDHLVEMLSAALRDGLGNWQVTDAYRSFEQQQNIWDQYYQKYIGEGMTAERAQRAANNRVAKVGTSDHHTGLSFDLNIPGQSFRHTKQYEWILQHAWEYGFILRFPEGKESYTGYSSEPWHVRYVGQPHAFNIRRTGMCLEEYMKTIGAS